MAEPWEIKVWLTVSGALNSLRKGNRDIAMPPYMEGVVVEVEPHRQGQRYYVRVEWENGQFGTYYPDDKTITFNRPKKSAIDGVNAESWSPAR